MNEQLDSGRDERIWLAEDGSLEIVAPAALLESMRQEASLAMNGPARGGVEVGGLLLGLREDQRVSIRDWRVIRCDHSLGASFQLSPRDVAALSCQIEGASVDSALSGNRVVGWFVSHRRGEEEVRPSELSLRQRLLPEDAALFLALRPNQFGDTEVRAYSLPGAGDSITAHPGILHLEPRAGLRWESPSVKAAEPDTPLAAGTPGSRSWLKVLAVATVLSCCGVLGWDLKRVRAAQAPAPKPVQVSRVAILEPLDLVSLHVRPVDRRIQISWDAQSKTVRTASGGTLTVVDRGRSFTRPMTPGELQLGRIDYNYETSRVQVGLLVERKDSTPLLEWAFYQAQAAEGQ